MLDEDVDSKQTDERPYLSPSDMIKAAALIAMILTLEETISSGKIIYLLIGH